MPYSFIPALFDASTIALFVFVAQNVATVPAQVYHGFWEGPTGLWIGGTGFAIYWIMKAIVEAKLRRTAAHTEATDTATPVMWQKLQEVLDAQRVAQQELIKTLSNLNEDVLKNREMMVAHDTYIKEHVGFRGAEIAREIGESIAPLTVNAIRGAFEDERIRTIAARNTTEIPKVPRTRKTKTRRAKKPRK